MPISIDTECDDRADALVLCKKRHCDLIIIILYSLRVVCCWVCRRIDEAVSDTILSPCAFALHNHTNSNSSTGVTLSAPLEGNGSCNPVTFTAARGQTVALTSCCQSPDPQQRLPVRALLHCCCLAGCLVAQTLPHACRQVPLPARKAAVCEVLPCRWENVCVHLHLQCCKVIQGCRQGLPEGVIREVGQGGAGCCLGHCYALHMLALHIQLLQQLEGEPQRPLALWHFV